MPVPKAAPVLEPEGGDPVLAQGFVSRNDQLCFKATRKEARKDKTRNNKRKAKGKTNKKRNKGKREGSTDSIAKKRHRKRKILQDASPAKKGEAATDHWTGWDGDTAWAGEEAAPRKRRARKTQACAEAKAAEEKAAPKSKAKAAPKSKAKAAPKSKAKAAPKKGGKRKQCDSDTSAADTTAPTQKAKKPRNKASEMPELSSPLRDPDMTQLLQDWAKQFPEKLEGKQAKLKRAVRAALTPLEKTRLVLYWTRNACGVRVLSCKKDSLHFTFNSWPTAGRFKLAVAVRCAELAVAWLRCAF